MPTGYQIKNQEGCHYLTLQVIDWIDVFSRKIYRDILIENLRYCQDNKGLEIFAFVIMSNHVHLVVRSRNNNLSGTIRDFKSFTSKEILNAINEENESRKEWMLTLFSMAAARHKRNSEFQFWTHENHAVELLSNKFIDQKIDYIHQNPVRAGIVEHPEEYIYSSAGFYAGRGGLIELDVE